MDMNDLFNENSPEKKAKSGISCESKQGVGGFAFSIKRLDPGKKLKLGLG